MDELEDFNILSIDNIEPGTQVLNGNLVSELLDCPLENVVVFENEFAVLEEECDTCDPADYYKREENYFKIINLFSELSNEYERAIARRNLGVADEYTLVWGNIHGNINNQKDLYELISNLEAQKLNNLKTIKLYYGDEEGDIFLIKKFDGGVTPPLLQITPQHINMGNSVHTLTLGNSTESVYIGAMSHNVYIGDSAADIQFGDSAYAIAIGNLATTVDIGYSAGYINLGESASFVDIGVSASSVIIGYSADVVDLGVDARNVNIGGFFSLNIATENDLNIEGFNIEVGYLANYIEFGNSAGTINIGNYAETIAIGGSSIAVDISAEFLTIGTLSSFVTIGGNSSTIVLNAEEKSSGISKIYVQDTDGYLAVMSKADFLTWLNN